MPKDMVQTKNICCTNECYFSEINKREIYTDNVIDTSKGDSQKESKIDKNVQSIFFVFLAAVSILV